MTRTSTELQEAANAGLANYSKLNVVDRHEQGRQELKQDLLIWRRHGAG
jgi:hypothetical protein